MKENKSCLSVVIPVYNEEDTLSEIVKKTLTVPRLLEVIIVDDCSTDRTPEIGQALAALHPQVRYFRQPKNGGKTQALRTGFAYTEGDIVIVQDADLEYDPAEIPQVFNQSLTDKQTWSMDHDFSSERPPVSCTSTTSWRTRH
jgi:glycosyltransferase involved in cell wall biosynthesis